MELELPVSWTVRAFDTQQVSPFATPFTHNTLERWLCTDVEVMTIPGEYHGEIHPDPSYDLESSCGGESQAEVVWLFVPEETGLLCFDTDGSDFDTVVSVRLHCHDGRTEVLCSADRPDGSSSAAALAVHVVHHEPLFVILDGQARNDFGRYSLTARKGPCE